MNKVTIEEIAKAVGLESLTPEIDASKISISDIDVNRPALQLAGFYDYFIAERVQIIGNVECAYLDSLESEEKALRVRALFEKKIPCLVYCINHRPSEEIVGLAIECGVPLFATPHRTSEMSEKIIHFLEDKLAETIIIHGVLIDVFGEGVLLTGESGIGKSEAALELIKRGHRLVSDDAVVIKKVDDETLIGTAPEVTRDFIELRGVGAVDVKTLFGLSSVKPEQVINFEINIEEWNREREYERLENDGEIIEYLGNKLQKFTIPLRPGRNLAVIVEAVAANFRQRSLGYNATDELYRRVNEKLGESQR